MSPRKGVLSTLMLMLLALLVSCGPQADPETVLLHDDTRQHHIDTVTIQLGAGVTRAVQVNPESVKAIVAIAGSVGMPMTIVIEDNYDHTIVDASTRTIVLDERYDTHNSSLASAIFQISHPREDPPQGAIYPAGPEFGFGLMVHDATQCTPWEEYAAQIERTSASGAFGVMVAWPQQEYEPFMARVCDRPALVLK